MILHNPHTYPFLDREHDLYVCSQEVHSLVVHKKTFKDLPHKESSSLHKESLKENSSQGDLLGSNPQESSFWTSLLERIPTDCFSVQVGRNLDSIDIDDKEEDHGWFTINDKNEENNTSNITTNNNHTSNDTDSNATAKNQNEKNHSDLKNLVREFFLL